MFGKEPVFRGGLDEAVEAVDDAGFMLKGGVGFTPNLDAGFTSTRLSPWMGEGAGGWGC